MKKKKMNWQFISLYICKLDEVPESFKHKYFRYFVTGFMVLIGGLAGIPWIETGLKLGEERFWLGYAAAVSVVIAYGITSIWAFLELTDLLKPQPEKQHSLIRHKNYYSRLYDHLSCHIVSILATLPTTYISYKFNTNLFYVALATFIGYSFNTVGLYQLMKIISAFWKRDSSNEKFYNSSLNTPFSISTMKVENRNFCIQAFSKLISSVIPFINALVTGIICYEGILALNLNFSSVGFFFFTAITLSLVVTPLLGIDLYAMRKFSEKLFNFKKSNLIANCSKETIIIVVFSLIISCFSALTDAYVAKTSADTSVFKSVSLFFAFIMWLTKTSLETVAVSTVIKQSLKFVQLEFNPSYPVADGTTKLSPMLHDFEVLQQTVKIHVPLISIKENTGKYA